MIPRDIAPTPREVRLKLRLPDSIALTLDEAAKHGGKEMLMRVSVIAYFMLERAGKLRRANFRRDARSSAVAITVDRDVLGLWRQAARQRWTRGTVDQLVTAALYQAFTMPPVH